MLKEETKKLVNNFLQTAQKPLIVVIGATASGKTSLSIELAKFFGGEIISADSRQIFRKLEIGSAKVTPAEMQDIPHYGIDLREPDESFTVAEFKAYALEKIVKILKRGKIPILAGGTGLYINALTQDFSLPKVPPNWELRDELEALATEALYQKLREIDLEEAKKIHPNNRRYVIRAIEIAQTTGKKKSEIMQKKKADFDILILGVEVEREILYERINQRVDQMLQNGFEAEVKGLMQAGYNFNLQAFNAVGYREMKAYFEGKMTYKEMAELMKQNTRNYAKRQLTWWRGDERVIWI